jgi:hypothetical protein
MTRQGPRKRVEADYWRGRLKAARDYLEAARNELQLADLGQDSKPIVSHIVLAAIAYTDAVTANRSRIVNQQDHGGAPRLLREVLGNLLPVAQERALGKILSWKDDAQYGVRPIALTQAEALFAVLESFAHWAEDQLP